MLHPGYDTIPRPLNTSQVRISRTNMDWPKLDWFRAVATVSGFCHRPCSFHVRLLQITRWNLFREVIMLSGMTIVNRNFSPISRSRSKYFRMFSRHVIGGKDFTEDDKSNVHNFYFVLLRRFACFLFFIIRCRAYEF